jgi:hypothetical protein
MNLKIKNKSLEYLNNNFSTSLYNVMKINRSDKNNSIQFLFIYVQT